MKKQILMVAVALSTLAITANAQEKQAAPKAKKQTIATTKDVKAKSMTAQHAKQPAAKASVKEPKVAEQKKTGK